MRTSETFFGPVIPVKPANFKSTLIVAESLRSLLNLARKASTRHIVPGARVLASNIDA